MPIERSPAVESARRRSSSRGTFRPFIIEIRVSILLLLMTKAPDICGQRGCLVCGELCPTHGRHRAAIFLGFRYAVGDHLQDSSETAVTPQPLLTRQRWTERRSGAIRAVATCAARSAHLAVKNAIAQSHHLGGCSIGNRDFCVCVRACVRIRAFGWLGRGSDDITGRRRKTRARSSFGSRTCGIAI